MMLAYFLFKTWKPGAPLPSFQSLAKVLAVACLGLQVWALSHPLLNYQKNHELAQQVWPGEEWMTDEEIEVHTGEWLRKYPHDPLLLYYKALAFEQKSNYREALRGFQKAASEKEMFDFYYGGMNTGLHFPDFFNCNFENVIQSQLAICLKRAGEKKEAKEVVRELRPRMWAADNKDIWSKLNEEGLGDDPEFYEGL
jgi:tetratricopeptide (TPR) repeat protein